MQNPSQLYLHSLSRQASRELAAVQKKRSFTKHGTPEQRAAAAEHARDMRAMWPTVKARLTRREWNQQVQASCFNLITDLRWYQAGRAK